MHVDREDTLSQAISLWRAIQTSEWRAEDDRGDHQPVFHAGAIAHLKRRLEDHTSNWRGWFAERGIEPLAIGYEAFSADPQGTVRRVLAYLDLPTDVPIPDPPMRRQSDGLSLEWAERFRVEVPA